MTDGYHPGGMDVETAARLYPIVVIAALIAVVAIDTVLATAHVLVLRGRDLLPDRVLHVAGWSFAGITVGLTTLLMSDAPFWWLGVAVTVAWLSRWAWRRGRLADLGVFIAGGALPWIATHAFFLAAFPADPVLGPPDRRFLVIMAAVIVAVLGTFLAIGAPRTGGGRAQGAIGRARLLFDAIEHEQAMGPLQAPAILGLLAGSVVALLLLVATRGVGLPIMLAGGGLAFTAVSLVVWVAAVPPRVAKAHATLGWLVGVERRILRERLGRSAPRTVTGMRDLLRRLPDEPALLPLKAELLATFGNIEEARATLGRVVAASPEEEAESADLAAYVAWCEGTTDERAIEALSDAIDRISGPLTRTRYRVALALARTRSDILAGRDGAIDHLVEVHAEIGTGASAMSLPYAWGVVGTSLLVGALTSLTGLTAALTPHTGWF
jgi:hypothetical protein